MNISESEILFVINPRAGKRNIDNILKTIKKINKGIKYIINDNLDDLDIQMKNEFDNFKVFVAVGGDGTVNSLMKYLINRDDKALAVLPLGSGNGFAKELGFKYDIATLLEQIKKGETLLIDVLKINGNSFINMAGIGFDAVIAHDFQKSETRGFFNYLISTFKTYFTYKPIEVTIKIDGKEMVGKFQMISIANTRQFGNNAFISPMSRPDDGKFDVVLLKTVPFFSAFPFIYKVFTGNLKENLYLKYLSCDSTITIETNCKKYHIDGDPMFSDGKYEVSIHKKCLKILKTQ